MIVSISYFLSDKISLNQMYGKVFDPRLLRTFSYANRIQEFALYIMTLFWQVLSSKIVFLLRRYVILDWKLTEFSKIHRWIIIFQTVTIFWLCWQVQGDETHKIININVFWCSQQLTIIQNLTIIARVYYETNLRLNTCFYSMDCHWARQWWCWLNSDAL